MRRTRQQRGVILLLVCFSMPMMIGMMGLGIDVGLMYAVKARLRWGGGGWCPKPQFGADNKCPGNRRNQHLEPMV